MGARTADNVVHRMHRRWRVAVCCAVWWVCAASGAVRDSSDLIFSDRIVHTYRITFYQSQWDTLLRFNKDNEEAYMPGRFTWYGPGGDSITLDSVGVRYKGNSSYVFAGTSPKKPFKVHFGKYRKKQRFFGVEKLNFNNGVQDPSCMREKLAYDILGKFMPAPRAAFAILTVMDSLKQSLYTQVEQVDELFLDRHFGGHKYNLYKAGDQGATLLYKGNTQASYEGEYELKTNETVNDWSGLIELIDLLNNTSDAAFVNVVGKRLDLDNCISALAFNMANCNFDSYTGSARNYYLYDNRAVGRFAFIPWDLNLSFGVFQYSWSNVVTVDAFAPSNLEQRPLARRIMANDSLKRVYARRLREFISGPLSVDSVRAHAHRLKAVIDSSVKRDAYKFYTYEQFVANVDTEVVIQEGITRTIFPGLASFTARRNANLTAQIERALPIRPREGIGASGEPALRVHFREKTHRLEVCYSVPGESGGGVPVSIRILSARGEVAVAQSAGKQPPGMHTVALDMRTVAPGAYLVQCVAGPYMFARTMVIVR